MIALARTSLLDDRPAWGTTTENAVRLRLEPLSDDESVVLARQASGRRIDDDEAAEIAQRAGGNPFFIIETTGMLLPDGDGETSAPRASLPPTVQAVVAARLDHLDPRLRELTRRASAFFVSFDLAELRTIDPEATPDEIRQLEEAEILVPEDDTHPVARWRVRHATLKEVAYASLPKRERVRLHQLIADRLFADSHPAWAADHLELAAVASLDLDRDDRTVAERAAEALLGLGRPRATTDGEPDGDRSLRAGTRARGSRGHVGRPRGARARRHRRGPVLARRVPGGQGRARPGGGARPQGRRPVHALARAAVPRRHRDQRRRRRRQGRGAARRVARRGGALRRAVGVRPHVAVRRLGAVDARRPRRGREDLAPRARGRRPRGRLGARAGAQLALDQPDRRDRSQPDPKRSSARRSS